MQRIYIKQHFNLTLILYRMGVQVPGSWQSIPAQAPLPGTTAPQITQTVSNSLPQTAGVVAYPMQQYQVNPQVKL